MEILEYNPRDKPSDHNLPDDEDNEIEYICLPKKDVSMDFVRRMYNNIVDSANSRDTENVTNCNPLLIELHNLQNKISVIENKANQLVKEAESLPKDEDNKINELVTFAIRSLSEDPAGASQFIYQVKTPIQLQENEIYYKGVSELEKSISTLKSSVQALKEQADNHPFNILIDELEHIATILNLSFLRRMEKDYSSSLSKCIRAIDKGKPDSKEVVNQLENVYRLALSISKNVKEVEKLLLKLFNQKSRLEKWDSLLIRMNQLEHKQDLCLQTIHEDQQILTQLEMNLSQARSQLQKNMDFVRNRK